MQQPDLKFLIVDDSDLLRRICVDIVREHIQDHNIKIFEAKDGLEAVEITKKEYPDIILMDIDMPKMDGIDASQAIKEYFKDDEEYSFIISIVSSTTNPSEINLGTISADSFHKKIKIDGVKVDEFVWYIRSLIDKLKLQQELVFSKFHDDLTTLFNLRYLKYFIEKLWKKNEKSGQKLNAMAVMLDIDDFKSINDTIGHFTADKILKRFAAVLLQYYQPAYKVCRYAGDEFILLKVLENSITDELQKEEMFSYDKIRKEVIQPLIKKEFNIDFTYSSGVEFFEVKHQFSLIDELGLADKKLYTSKQKGKNLSWL